MALELYPKLYPGYLGASRVIHCFPGVAVRHFVHFNFPRWGLYNIFTTIFQQLQRDLLMTKASLAVSKCRAKVQRKREADQRKREVEQRKKEAEQRKGVAEQRKREAEQWTTKRKLFET